MIGIVFAAAISTTPPNPTMSTIGIGFGSCANWLETPAKTFEGEAWLFGYWTGLNQFNSNSHVGAATDGPAIIAEVRKLCEAEPTMELQNAIYKTYLSFERRGI